MSVSEFCNLLKNSIVHFVWNVLFKYPSNYRADANIASNIYFNLTLTKINIVMRCTLCCHSFFTSTHGYVWLRKLNSVTTQQCTGLTCSLWAPPTGSSTQTEIVLFGHWAELLFYFITCYYTFHFSFHYGRLIFLSHCQRLPNGDKSQL